MESEQRSTQEQSSREIVSSFELLAKFVSSLGQRRGGNTVAQGVGSGILWVLRDGTNCGNQGQIERDIGWKIR